VQFLTGAEPRWSLKLEDSGFGIAGARRRWDWSALTRVRLFGGRMATTLELTTGDARIEAFGRVLPVTSVSAWSQARVRHLAHRICERSGLTLEDENPRVEDLLHHAVNNLRLLAEPTREAHDGLFVADPWSSDPPCEDTEGGLRVELGWETVLVFQRSVRFRGEEYAFSDLAAVDLMVQVDHDSVTRTDRGWGTLMAVYQGRPKELFSMEVTHGGALQLLWLARHLDHAARSVPYTEDLDSVPDALRKLRE
jgi:hypothetical protein